MSFAELKVGKMQKIKWRENQCTPNSETFQSSIHYLPCLPQQRQTYSFQPYLVQPSLMSQKMNPANKIWNWTRIF